MFYMRPAKGAGAVITPDPEPTKGLGQYRLRRFKPDPKKVRALQRLKVLKGEAEPIEPPDYVRLELVDAEREGIAQEALYSKWLLGVLEGLVEKERLIQANVDATAHMERVIQQEIE